MNKIGLFLIFILVLLSSSCIMGDLITKDVTLMDIAEIKVALNIDVSLASSNKNIIVDKIFPGQILSVEITTITKAGKIITNPDYRNFTISSPNGTLNRFIQDWHGIYIYPELENFTFIDGHKYQLEIGVKDNDEIKTLVEWELDWNNFSVLDFSGRNGYNKRPDGDNGINVELDIAEYKLESGEKAVVVYDKLSSRLFLLKTQDVIKIFSNGGDGYNGEKGKDAILDAKIGEDGEDAGNGGHGGRIIINYYKESTINIIDQDTEPVTGAILKLLR